MSTNLHTAESNDRDVRDCHITSFSGGVKGQMLQLAAGVGSDLDSIQMNEQQVRSAMATMQVWLNARHSCLMYGEGGCVHEATQTVEGTPAAPRARAKLGR